MKIELEVKSEEGKNSHYSRLYRSKNGRFLKFSTVLVTYAPARFCKLQKLYMLGCLLLIGQNDQFLEQHLLLLDMKRSLLEIT